MESGAVTRHIFERIIVYSNKNGEIKWNTLTIRIIIFFLPFSRSSSSFNIKQPKSVHVFQVITAAKDVFESMERNNLKKGQLCARWARTTVTKQNKIMSLRCVSVIDMSYMSNECNITASLLQIYNLAEQ